MQKQIIQSDNVKFNSLINGLLSLSGENNWFSLLVGNETETRPSIISGPDYKLLCAIGSARSKVFRGHEFHSLKKFIGTGSNQIKNPENWLFGHLSYDMKNDVENLSSGNFDGIGFEHSCFFKPEHVFTFLDDEWNHYAHESVTKIESDYLNEKIFRNIQFNLKSGLSPKSSVVMNHRVTRNEYIDRVKKIQQHIQKGDIYETNFCIEFFQEKVMIDPVAVFLKLNELSPAPFSAFYKTGSRYLLCSSPERFIMKRGNRVVSQPIKGTIKRGKNSEDDERLRSLLKHDPKERAENIMITDLVRNDLSRYAEKGSVIVDELCGTYGFSNVWQMISTISCKVKEDADAVDIIKAAFPMGSMTGAPKKRAMELIERYETTKRGLYSGSVGYFSPNGDFDFNVIIRSILYNAESQYLSVMVGSAITALSDPEKEYEECLLKATAMFQALE